MPTPWGILYKIAIGYNVPATGRLHGLSSRLDFEIPGKVFATDFARESLQDLSEGVLPGCYISIRFGMTETEFRIVPWTINFLYYLKEVPDAPHDLQKDLCSLY